MSPNSTTTTCSTRWRTPRSAWASPSARQRSRRKAVAPLAPMRWRSEMTVIATAADAIVNRRRGSAADGVTFWHTLYIGTSRYNMAPGTPDPAMGELFPMAFLVEQDPGSTATAHNHQADQFQVIISGHDSLRTHEANPERVHFAR